MQTTQSESTIGFTRVAMDVLNRLLSDEQVLLMKLRNCHWNVAGPQFRELHALFEEQYDILTIRIDQVAERIRALGTHATATMTEYLQQTSLREHPGSFPAAHQLLLDALGDHEILIRFIGESLASPSGNEMDVGTVDLLTCIIQDHEKMAWALRATLSDNPEDPHRRPVLYE